MTQIIQIEILSHFETRRSDKKMWIISASAGQISLNPPSPDETHMKICLCSHCLSVTLFFFFFSCTVLHFPDRQRWKCHFCSRKRRRIRPTTKFPSKYSPLHPQLVFITRYFLRVSGLWSAWRRNTDQSSSPAPSSTFILKYVSLSAPWHLSVIYCRWGSGINLQKKKKNPLLFLSSKAHLSLAESW